MDLTAIPFCRWLQYQREMNKKENIPNSQIHMIKCVEQSEIRENSNYLI